MDSSETREVRNRMEGSRKSRRHPLMPIVGSMLLVGVFAMGLPAGAQTPKEIRRSQTPAPVSGVDPQEALRAFAQCMRDHGIAKFPDPVNGGLNLRDTGIDPSTPEFQAAQKACEIHLPRRPPRGGGNSQWQKIVPGGDCVCADGSEFAFWERKPNPTKPDPAKPNSSKVVFYLDGGGVCFDAITCAFTGTAGENDFYDYNISGESPGMGGGIFDFDRAENPFTDYTFIYVPLCTGDAYLGNRAREYSPELTVQHKGFVNGTAALSYLAKQYPNAAQVVVLGKTAGSIAAPIFGGLAADLLPNARVTVFGAQSGAFPVDPDFNAEIFEPWGAFDTMPNWSVNKGLTASDWGPRQFWIQAGLHAPGVVMARFDYAFDQNAARRLKSRGVDPSTMVALIDANEAAIEAAGVVQHSYTAPGDSHGIIEYDIFYDLEVNGVGLVDWIKALLDGKPLEDVHCVNCDP